jgi:hypothetical protein
LKYDLKPSPNLSERFPIHFQKVFSLEFDLAFGRFNQSKEATADCGLATSAFTHQPKGLTLLQRKAQIIDRSDPSYGSRKDALPERKVFFEVTDLEKRIVFHSYYLTQHNRKQIGFAVKSEIQISKSETNSNFQNSNSLNSFVWNI